jgi:signal transduction histidine kinase
MAWAPSFSAQLPKPGPPLIPHRADRRVHYARLVRPPPHIDAAATKPAEDSEERARLADLLDQRGEEVARRWAGQSSGSLTLAPALNDYLAGLSRALRLPGPVPVAAAAVWRELADRHDLTPSRRGFDLEALARQLVSLRETLAAVAAEKRAADVTILDALIDAALVQSVSSYVHHRDDLAKVRQAEYVGFVTHELRNPLTTAMLAASRLPAGGSPQDQRAVSLVDRNLKRVARLVDTFLLNEHLDADRIQPHKVKVLVGDLLDAVLKPAEVVANRPHVRLDRAVDPALVVEVDPSLTITALQNVVTSCIQFTDKALVTIRAEDERERLVLHVRDHCQGLSQEELAQLLQPFHASHPAKPAPGLGLTVARRLIEEQGGGLTVESDEVTGECHFLVALPKATR